MEVRTVLCPVDFSDQTGRELSIAEDVCRHFGARLVVEHNLDPRPPNFLTVTWMWSEEFEGQEEHKAGKAQERLRILLDDLAQRVSCEGKLTRGPIDEVLLLLVKDLSADLLVMGSHGLSTPEHRSLTEKMIAKCPVPVLTVGSSSELPRIFGDGESTRGACVLVSVDDDRKVSAATLYAARLAAHVGGELILLEVVTPGGGTMSPERLAAAEGRLRQLLGDSMCEDVRSHAVEGDEVTAILEQADKGHAGLLVRPVHGGVMPWKRKGRQSDYDLLHRSPCPVIYVPAGYGVGAAA